MFTGIVAALGTVRSVTPEDDGARLVLDAAGLAKTMDVGDSIAVNGACLTAVTVDGGVIEVQAVEETLRRTNLGDLAAGDAVDLERPVPASGSLDGHIVQGHVDGVGRIRSIEPEGDARRVRIEIEGSLARYVAEKGSIAVDGVSLTVTGVGDGEPSWFEVVLIPHTLEVTVLGRRAPGDRVNLEVDILAKYVERLMEARS